jgi:2-oxoisovalerate dehydrogenase E1 component beta subunit
MTAMTMAKALNEGMRKAMEADPKVVIMGEDVGKLGGVFRITDGLQKDARSVRSSSTASSSPASTRSSARSPSSTTVRPAW